MVLPPCACLLLPLPLALGQASGAVLQTVRQHCQDGGRHHRYPNHSVAYLAVKTRVASAVLVRPPSHDAFDAMLHGQMLQFHAQLPASARPRQATHKKEAERHSSEDGAVKTKR